MINVTLALAASGDRCQSGSKQCNFIEHEITLSGLHPRCGLFGRALRSDPSGTKDIRRCSSCMALEQRPVNA